MHQYSVRDVEKLARLPRRKIRSLVEAGLVSPARGPRNAWRFSFQDLIVLRAAQSLAAAKVPRKRITSSVRELRRRLPDSVPLSTLNISAEAEQVVVKEGDRSWQAESGQYLLGFEGPAPSPGLGPGTAASPVAGPAQAVPSVEPDHDFATFLERQSGAPPATRFPPAKATSPASGEDWFERGVALETLDPRAAVEAYEQAIVTAPGLVKARINLGCLLHETGRFDQAEAVYREALRRNPRDPVLLYDLGVLLHDRGRKREAMEAYEAALRDDPAFADCHYNLALLCKGLKPREAIQHMAAYRRLIASITSE